jgi:hypothetical protein
MFPRISRIIATLALLICLICPLLELFDYWDHTAQTGSDTEYTFVVLGLCVGALYAFARFVSEVQPTKSAASIVFGSRVRASSLLSKGQGSFFIVQIPLSPPILALRV